MNVIRSLCAALALSVISVTPSYAQTTELPFGSAGYNATLPVEITSDSFRISQSDQSAEFEGNVLVTQGNMRFSAGKVIIEYSDNNASETRQIERLLATGGVTIVIDAQAAEAETAVYTIESGNIEMQGQVLLTQGQSAISGQNLTINLATGSAEISGRVKTILNTVTSN